MGVSGRHNGPRGLQARPARFRASGPALGSSRAAEIVSPAFRELSPFPPVPDAALVVPVGIAFLLYGLVRTRYYLSTFWSDVMFWTIQEEKDERFIAPEFLPNKPENEIAEKWEVDQPTKRADFD